MTTPLESAERAFDDAFAELMDALETIDEQKSDELAAATIASFAIATAAIR